MAVILVTEDEPMVREYARDIVLQCGHEALDAATFDEALVILSSDCPIDILFTDINLRPLTRGGLELARRALKLRPMLHVIYTTGMALDDDIRGMLVDRARFLPKPYTPETLSGTIKQLLRDSAARQ